MLVSQLSIAQPAVQLLHWILVTSINSAIALFHNDHSLTESAPEEVTQLSAHTPCAPFLGNSDILPSSMRSNYPFLNKRTGKMYGLHAAAQSYQQSTTPGHPFIGRATESSNHHLSIRQDILVAGSGGQQEISGRKDSLVRAVGVSPFPLYNPYDDSDLHMPAYHPWQAPQWPASQNEYCNHVVQTTLDGADGQWRNNGDSGDSLITTTSPASPETITDFLARERVIGGLSSTSSPLSWPQVLGSSNADLIAEYRASGGNPVVASNFVPSSPITLSKETTQLVAPGGLTYLLKPAIWFKVKDQPPLHILGKKLISESIGPFKEALDTIDRIIPVGGGVKIKFEGITACQYFTESKCLIRVMISAGRLDDLTNVGHKLSHLLESIGYCFMIIIAPAGTQQETAQTLFSDLFGWLWKNFFNPDDSLPVVGEVRRPITHRKRSAFGPLQQCLVDHLNKIEDTRNKEVDVVAMWILGLWFKNTSPHTWKDTFPTDKAFWDHVATEVISNEASLPSSSRTVSDQHSPSAFNCLGDLGIPLDFDYVLYRALAKPGYPQPPHFQNQFDHCITEIFMSLKQALSSETDVLWSRRTVHFPELAAAALALENPTQLATHSIHLLKGWRLRPAYEIRRKLEKLLYTLTLNHEAFLELANHQQWLTKKKWQIEVIVWLQGQLLSPNPEESYPVFGQVKGPIQHNFEKPFGLIQLYLIYYFTYKIDNCHKYRLKTQMTSLCLLRDWYKNENPEFWQKHFGCDKAYWLFVRQTDCSKFKNVAGQLSSVTSNTAKSILKYRKWT